jgi:ATP-dependent RNA helicase
MKLKPALFDGIISLGFERPSAIQQRAILPIIKGRDVICQSQSGTGKTAVFCIGALQVLKEDRKLSIQSTMTNAPQKLLSVFFAGIESIPQVKFSLNNANWDN